MECKACGQNRKQDEFYLYNRSTCKTCLQARARDWKRRMKKETAEANERIERTLAARKMIDDARRKQNDH